MLYEQTQGEEGGKKTKLARRVDFDFNDRIDEFYEEFQFSTPLQSAWCRRWFAEQREKAGLIRYNEYLQD